MSQDSKLSIATKGLDVLLRVLGSHGRFLSREDRQELTPMVCRQERDIVTITSKTSAVPGTVLRIPHELTH